MPLQAVLAGEWRIDGMQELQREKGELQQAQAAAAKQESERLRAADTRVRQLEADVKALKAQLASAQEVMFLQIVFRCLPHSSAHSEGQGTRPLQSSRKHRVCCFLQLSNNNIVGTFGPDPKWAEDLMTESRDEILLLPQK